MKNILTFIVAYSCLISSCSVTQEIKTQTQTQTQTTTVPPPVSVERTKTGIPVFIGYTEKAKKSGQSLIDKPTKIKTLLEYEQFFGKENKSNSTTPLGHHYMYESIQQFFDHGGQDCYVLSVGNYSATIVERDLTEPLVIGSSLEKILEPDLIIIPDALALTKFDCYLAYQKVLNYCGRMEKGMGIFDIHNGFNKSDLRVFRENIGNDFLKYGTTYFPWMQKGNQQIPTCGIMAGLIAKNDRNHGVWKAPANINLNSGITPTLNISNQEQGVLNIDATSGKSINAIRSFEGRGVVVWGARTLDGNSLDYRYISTMRTVEMLKQSIKIFLEKNKSKSNTQSTWEEMEEKINSFLKGIWQDGGLQGASYDEAFGVDVGLGTTMTAQDILEKKMIVRINVALTRPAEFFSFTFIQEMEK